MMTLTLPMPNPVIAGPCRCGSHSVMWKQKKLFDSIYIVECSREGCEEPSAWGYTGAKAAESWNRQQEANEEATPGE